MKANDFKIIAIRPLVGCNKRHLKILHTGTVYRFYNNYKFFKEDEANPDSKIIKIEVDSVILPDLYKINREYGKDLNVNISAIVGKNGSGKSTLIELLYVFLYNISLQVGVLPLREETGKSLRKKVSKINIEVYYTTDGRGIKSLSCYNDKYEIKTFNRLGEIENLSNLVYEDLKNLFYTISVNYSHYALNSTELGKWLENVFHKNDSYQTPIVINPFRDDGIIDINNEDELVKSRILSNILFNEKSKDKKGSVQILPDKVVKSIKFTLDSRKGLIDTGNKKHDSLLRNEATKIVQKTFDIFKVSHLLDRNPDSKHLQVAYNYIVRKIYSIQKKYTSFKKKNFDFIVVDKSNAYIIDYKKLENLIIEIQRNKSHITFKFKQAINFILNAKRDIIASGRYITLEELRSYVNEGRNIEDIINYVPPSFFTFDIQFTKGRNYSSLSSGEKQRIFSTATILYHLYNLNSVEKNRGLTKYTSVNIIFDEIELYFHPEWQRQFVSNILDSIKIIDIPDIESLNMIFVTHSPFVLSDIPSNNILFLNQDGTPNTIRIERTFGANIHNLLEDSFFHNEGTVGRFAKDKIIRTLNWLKIQGNQSMNNNFFDDIDHTITYDKNENKKEYHKSIIEMIDEPVVKYQLKKMYINFIDDNDYIQTEIDRISKNIKN